MLATSGFGWDNERIVVTTTDEVWEEYIRSHLRAERLRGKRIDRMDDLAVIVGSDQATGRYVQRSIAASSSRIQRDLNEAWRDLENDLDDTIDLSEDKVADLTGTNQFSLGTPLMENRMSRGTPTRTSDSDGSRGGTASKKRMRPPHPCDVLDISLKTVAEAIRDFGLGKEVNRTSKVLDVLEEVQGLTNSKFIEVSQLLSRNEKFASFFVSLRLKRPSSG
ncbi:uncharacterized protein LOC131247050 [Magnolia sinica]|uniref:uncharacterized protein LOC131247050 n=1 Tax=Magnolia sinica TaxID=86752 RepID=UPI0026595623|nr:uncharacterized protein LOC131247050 [Magnolia sinica]